MWQCVLVHNIMVRSQAYKNNRKQYMRVVSCAALLLVITFQIWIQECLPDYILYISVYHQKKVQYHHSEAPWRWCEAPWRWCFKTSQEGHEANITTLGGPAHAASTQTCLLRTPFHLTLWGLKFGICCIPSNYTLEVCQVISNKNSHHKVFTKTYTCFFSREFATKQSAIWSMFHNLGCACKIQNP